MKNEKIVKKILEILYKELKEFNKLEKNKKVKKEEFYERYSQKSKIEEFGIDSFTVIMAITQIMEYYQIEANLARSYVIDKDTKIKEIAKFINKAKKGKITIADLRPKLTEEAPKETGGFVVEENKS
jgi:acyl carrier protein